MPLEPIPRTPAGWPYLPDAAPVADVAEYTRQVAGALAGFTPGAAAPLGDTGWLADVVTKAGGATTIANTYIRRWGPLVIVMVGNVMVPVSIPITGDIANIPVAQVPAGFYPSRNQGLGTGLTGRVSAYNINTAGVISMAATTPSATQTGTVAVTEDFSIAGAYFA